ncbi:unnamed protein product [Phytophthora lilii]|uniref:Unnamed protein product n=1 Tax=Phytophthora lilii TaxID=2077276 RepID=A0A9W6YED2_9STRA|nr:unnamed protein product [Phytophthora lilii]
MQFEIAIEKTDKGFGIYFAKVVVTEGNGDVLAVDGFVEALEDPLVDKQSSRNKEALSSLQLGDVLVGVNGEDCKGRDIAEILDILRSAKLGLNTLVFSRIMTQATVPGTDEIAKEPIDTSTRGFMGALLKVKSKIRAEIDGDEEELLREQLEDELFEKQWLEEFEGLKKQYEARWETCTYTADEFCGLLYRSSDSQHKELLLQQYPTLMEAWKDDRASSNSSRVIPEWPAINLAHDSIYPAEQTTSSSCCGVCPKPRWIHCSQALQKVLECLRVNFMWRAGDIHAFSQRLDADGISSCSALLEALTARSGYFERNFQSSEYPRLSKTILRALYDSVQGISARAGKSTENLPLS